MRSGVTIKSKVSWFKSHKALGQAQGVYEGPSDVEIEL